MSQSITGEDILELARSYQRSQALLAAVELGVYQTLGHDSLPAGDLAQRLDTDRRATEILLNALVTTGLLEKDGTSFSVPEALLPLLVDDGDDNVLAMVRHQVTIAHRWDRLASVARTGVPERECAVADLTPVERRAFIEAMHVIGRRLADGIVAKLEPARYRRALDIGGGSGTYTIALLSAAPDLRATLFDLPPVVDMARARLEARGLADRVDLVAGDFYEDPLPGGHDLALLSAIIHQNSREQNRSLFSKCLAALVPSGEIVVRDIIMDDSHTAPPAGALFAINMLVATEGGGTYSFAEIRDDLEAAGFRDVALVQEGEWMDSLVRARRP